MSKRHFTHHSFRSIEFFRIQFYRIYRTYRICRRLFLVISIFTGKIEKFSFVIEVICYWIISNDFNLDSCLDPAFCFNGGTCEVTMTGARCHCIDRYQGDRCDMCSERFQGDECDRCADGYLGDSCSFQVTYENFQIGHEFDHSGGIRSPGLTAQ